MKHFLSLTLSMFVMTALVAQNTDQNNFNNRSAEELYENLGYKAAIPKFEKQEEMDISTINKLASAYRLNHDTENAELWYSQLVEVSDEPIHYLHYAQALQSNGKYEPAKNYYLKYDEMIAGDNPDRRGAMLANAIDMMNDLTHTETEIKNEKMLNSEKLDFSPCYYKSGIVFVSSRGVGKGDRMKDAWIDDNFMALFHAERNEEGISQEPKLFSHNLTSKFHEGPVSFSKNGDRIFFTRNHYNKGKRRNNSDGVMKMNIYTAVKENDEWYDPVELNFNTVEYEECHPSISPDGRSLFFASDKPGGYGGMDLYVTYLSAGNWSSPINLGANINTAGNEVFPFIHDDGTLYFSSNGLGGIGGLDIYSATMMVDSSWAIANNIGTPFNSPKDDFGFILNLLGTEGYLSSARNGGKGQDDIYSFVIPKGKKTQPDQFRTIITVVGKDTGAKLEGAQISILEKIPDGVFNEDDFQLLFVEEDIPNAYSLRLKKDGAVKNDPVNGGKTDLEGKLNIQLDPDKKYVLVSSKDGYKTAEQVISTKGRDQEITIIMEPFRCMSLEGKVVNAKYKTAIREATVTMINLCSGEEFKVVSDSDGVFTSDCLECNCDYVLKAEKSKFKPATSTASTIGANCSAGGKINLLLELGAPSPEEMVAIMSGKDMVKSLIGENEIKEGSIIEVPNIYYDFDKYYIRNEDASKELDKVVALLMHYPGMVIELSSHTDSRGKQKYNKWLSRKRADAAVQYIISRGIDARRLIARGYGETELRNNCTDGITCTEEDHQYNRRTEVKILATGDTGVSVRYKDNAPEKIDHAPQRNERGY